MTNAQLIDLKTFIASTMKDEVSKLRTEMDGRFDQVLDAIGERFDHNEALLEHHSATNADHEARTVLLERRAT